MNPFKGSSRLGATPVPETPYQRAGQAWDERIGSASVQAANWRLIALGLLAANIVQSGGMIWQAARGALVPWVVEVDRLGQTLAVGPAVRGYRPPDPVIAWTLSRFIENTRSVPADAVVLGQNWRSAYDFTDAERRGGAVRLRARRRSLRGDRQGPGLVEISNVVRASPDSFRLAWIERRYVEGQLVHPAVERHPDLVIAARPRRTPSSRTRSAFSCGPSPGRGSTAHDPARTS
jgi:type IV secretory pathway TrbF-like protein